MKHLSDSAAVTMAEGARSEEARRHVGECARCQELVTRYRRLLDGLEIVKVEPFAEAPADLLRWARACTRTRPRQVPRSTWLHLLAFGAQAMAAVRGGYQAGASALFGSDRFQIDLQVEPLPDGGHQLLGQIVPIADDQERIWTIEVVTATGATYQSTADYGGEFCIEELDSWEGLSMVATSHEERLLVPRLGGGENDQEG
jgi:hypothetical protein